MSHVPGPWARDYFRQVAGVNGQVVYLDDFTFGSRSTEESQANTRRSLKWNRIISEEFFCRE